MSATTPNPAPGPPGFGAPWLALCAALAAHLADEAHTGFLGVYNPTALEIRRRLGWSWWPPVFAFNDWLFGLLAAVLVLLVLAPLAFRNARWLRPLAYGFAMLMIANGLGHTLGTIRGASFAAIRFPRPMPGFYSSPLLVAASVWLMLRLRRSHSERRQ